MKNKDRWTNPTDRIRLNKEKDIKRAMIEKAKKAFCSATCTVCEHCDGIEAKCKQYYTFVKLLEE